MAKATNTRRIAAQPDDHDSAETEATLAESLSQTFKITCSFCGRPVSSPEAVGRAAEYNDRGFKGM